MKNFGVVEVEMSQNLLRWFDHVRRRLEMQQIKVVKWNCEELRRKRSKPNMIVIIAVKKEMNDWGSDELMVIGRNGERKYVWMIIGINYFSRED